INGLPSGDDTTRFSTANASGSTSQAAGLMEALSSGARVLLIDEDTSATNFMIRDERMRRLIPDDREPITPLVARVRELWE
ncbi:ABC-ATPase domain-containing protein, partial [Escherichia coli]|nr:ABC-ATPase domain-containing protein [Escherichia coli]